jgi:hypothetical protein
VLRRGTLVITFCDAKQTHASRGAAKAAVRCARKRGGHVDRLDVYRCARCKGWHLIRASTEGTRCAKSGR